MVIFLKLSVSGNVILNVATHMSLQSFRPGNQVSQEHIV